MDAAAIGRRVNRLRKVAGLAQSELAERVGVPAGTVSMLENGRHRADELTLRRLARTLGCSVDYLTHEAEEPQATKPWLRAYADAPQRTIAQTEADGATAIDAFESLGLKRVPDTLPAFDSDPNDGRQIERFAALVRAVAGLDEDDVASNAMRSAERLGVVILPIESELGRHLGMSQRIDGIPVIRVARPSATPEGDIPGDRQRFTTAHELGHLALHYDTPPPDSPSAAAIIEKQAHRFAGAFLAPADPLLADLDTLGGRVTLTTLTRLKEKWGVAIKALVVRLSSLGVVDDYHARSLYKQISARRWNKTEPVHVGNERAVWLIKALEQYSGDPSAQSGLNREHFERWTDWTPVQQETETTGTVLHFRRA